MILTGQDFPRQIKTYECFLEKRRNYISKLIFSISEQNFVRYQNFLLVVVYILKIQLFLRQHLLFKYYSREFISGKKYRIKVFKYLGEEWQKTFSCGKDQDLSRIIFNLLFNLFFYGFFLTRPALNFFSTSTYKWPHTFKICS